MIRKVMAALSGKRFPLEDEKRTQAEIEKAFNLFFGETALVMREAVIAGGIIDFAIVSPEQLGLVGVEVKIKGTAASISRQVRRYLDDPGVDGLVLVTSKPCSLPSEINGKPVAVFDLGRAWL